MVFYLERYTTVMKYTLFVLIFVSIMGIAGNVHADTQLLHTVQFGDTNSDVVQLQTFLIQHGFLHTNATGYFGPLTQTALAQALSVAHQPQSNVVTPSIMAALTVALPPQNISPSIGVSVGTGATATIGTSANGNTTSTTGTATGGVSNTATGTHTGGVDVHGGVTTTVGTSMPVLTISKTVYYKETSQDVVKLQTVLIQKGFLHANATGYFGQLTLIAVNQACARLGITGGTSVTPATMTAITNMSV